MLPDVVFGCLRQAIPDRVPAEGTSCLWNLNVRGPLPGSASKYGFSMVVTSNGGTGARPGKDGLSATAFPSGVKNCPVEITEALSPILVTRKEYRVDSGGAGEFRGGLGQVMEAIHLDNSPFLISANYDRVVFPPRGRDGGADGMAGMIEASTQRRPWMRRRVRWRSAMAARRRCSPWRIS